MAGKKFLALEQKSGNVHVWDEHFRNYGAWMTVDSFRKNYKKEGEALALDG